MSNNNETNLKDDKGAQRFYQEFRIYKPRKENGSACSFQVSLKQDKRGYRKLLLFCMVAPQTGVSSDGNASFAWKDPQKLITATLGDPDIGEILLVLNDKKQYAGPPGKNDKPPAGLYHRNSRGNTIVKFERTEKWGLQLTMSAQRDGQSASRVSVSITDGEAELLKILLVEYIRAKYLWI
jgi:hypothetical protein